MYFNTNYCFRISISIRHRRNRKNVLVNSRRHDLPMSARARMTRRWHKHPRRCLDARVTPRSPSPSTATTHPPDLGTVPHGCRRTHGLGVSVRARDCPQLYILPTQREKQLRGSRGHRICPEELLAQQEHLFSCSRLEVIWGLSCHCSLITSRINSVFLENVLASILALQGRVSSSSHRGFSLAGESALLIVPLVRALLRVAHLFFCCFKTL